MERRDFFRSLIGGALIAREMDLDALLWTPKRKTIFISNVHTIRFANPPGWDIASVFLNGVPLIPGKDFKISDRFLSFPQTVSRIDSIAISYHRPLGAEFYFPAE